MQNRHCGAGADQGAAAAVSMLFILRHISKQTHSYTCRTAIVGLVLTKELLQYDPRDETPVGSVKMRVLPRLAANTPM